MYIRVRDKGTRHEFDVQEDSILLARGTVEQVKPKLYPPSRYQRPAKHHITLAARAVPVVAEEATDKEN